MWKDTKKIVSLKHFMRKQQCLLLLVWILGNSWVAEAQTIVHYPTVIKNREPLLSAGVSARGPNGDPTFSLMVSTADDSTTYYFPVNKLSDQVNVAYFLNTRRIGVSFSVNQQVHIEDIRFRIFEKDSSATARWQPVKGRMVGENERNGTYRTNIILPPIACNNKILYLQAYHINDPESLLTQIVSTKVITRPSITALYHMYKSTKNAYESYRSAYTDIKPLASRVLETVVPDDRQEIYTGQLLLITDNEPAVYRAFIIRSYEGREDSILLNQHWEKIKGSKSITNSLLKLQPADMKSTIYTIPIPQEFLTKPGKYRLAVVPGFLQPGSATKFAHAFHNQITSFNYTVQRSRSLQDWLTLILSILGLLSIPFIMILFYRKRQQKTNLQQQEQFAKESRLKLDYVRAQLNPHFVYNALSGIQNLLQKNEVRAADNYLAKFARLSRKILNDSERELISLEDEIRMLDEYLQMEQMRFNFQYHFQTGEDIDILNTEIPAMLIQPFVENAVKHGVSSVPDGHITIQFKKNSQNMLINILDNGKGYNPDISSGKGSVLSHNRIDLLNNLYRITPIHLSVKSGEAGTHIQITLNDWLA